jgi:uncharacterized damage-inducible protein DinB
MFTLFQYNWQVRDDWFNWCAAVPEEELLAARTGGVGGILKTLFHVVDVEYSWISALQGKPDFEEPFDSYCTLRDIRDLSERFHVEIEPFVRRWTSEQELTDLRVQRLSGEWMTYKHGEIMRHVIAHEIHHMGQLSWARDIGREPITANLIRRGLYG